LVRELTDRLTQQPGVAAAGMTSSVPLMETIGAEQATIAVEGAPDGRSGEPPPQINYAITTGGFFEALGVPLRRGRLYDDRDDASAAPVVLVNDAFVRRFLPNVDPIGRRVRLDRMRDTANTGGREIIGVVGDLRRFSLTESARPWVYLPHAQSPTGATAIVVRGSLPPEQLIGEVKRLAWERVPTMPMSFAGTMSEVLGASVRDRRFVLLILGGFAVMALGLAAAGIFGVMSYATADRVREIGVRMAFGANRRTVLTMVLRKGAALTALGVLFGLAGGIAGARILRGMLYRVTPFDPMTFTVAVIVMFGAALIAAWYPAWRASSTDPLVALRTD
jgi:predicted permease